MTAIRKVLFITLSNIGDCILTLPVLDSLRENFPGAEFTVMSGPRPKEIFEGNPLISRLIVFDKHAGLRDKIKLFNQLKKEGFDLIVDLRNTFFGALLPAKYRMPFQVMPAGGVHMKDRHLLKIKKFMLKTQNLPGKDKTFHVRPEDERYIQNLFEENGVVSTDNIIVMAPGARSHIKRWVKERFLELAEALQREFSAKIILIGDKQDAENNKHIAMHSTPVVIDLTGKTSLTQLACLLEKTRLLVTNDSATLHLAGYFNTPTLAIFGPTNEIKYGPWSENKRIVKKDIFCRPCEKAQCKFASLSCMKLIKVEDVLREARVILGAKPPRRQGEKQLRDFRRILIVRTDRIGDVILSTPVIKTMRDNYPDAFISMMVSPYAREVVEGNPYLDEVLVYDKDGKHKGWLKSMAFAAHLRERRFDLALVLHPTNRVHLLVFFAGIGRRLGYDRKMGFLLTDRIKHLKHLGEKHELEYNLDIVRHLGIEVTDKEIFMPIKKESENWADDTFRALNFKKTDKIIAVHPAASCPSKIWPKERFAALADSLIEKYGVKVLFISGPKDTGLVQGLMKHMRHQASDLSGRSTVSQTASLLKRCRLFISNDSGPVHIACAVGTPVISIFGRGQAGLSPRRWGPTGKSARILHKKTGCIECLAHNCVRRFECLRAISVADVLGAADELLKND